MPCGGNTVVSSTPRLLRKEGSAAVLRHRLPCTRRWTDEFEALRPQLLVVAYRLTGTVVDAEDVLQDAWLRWQSAGERSEIAELRPRWPPGT